MAPETREELLAAHHEFPGVYRIKVIGSSDNEFAERVIAAAVSQLSAPDEVAHSIRNTSGGRHLAITLDLNVVSAEQVLAIYGKLRQVEGLTLLL